MRVGNHAGKNSFSRWLARPETLVALSALLLSLCGLFVAVYEASLMRKSERASVWPFVQVSPSLTDERIAVWVQNTGVGPARVQAASLQLNNETVARWSELLEALPARGDVDTYESMLNGRVLPAGSEPEDVFRLLRDGSENNRALAAAFWTLIREGDLDLTVCYCSVYDECWIASLQDTIRPERDTSLQSVETEVEDCSATDRSRI
ncbi:MAG: hypothetical protein KJO31_07990 [Gammaproteobacteria bacterium]|nr:hypothetical protein [Gammaproteobacteria bacterium]